MKVRITEILKKHIEEKGLSAKDKIRFWIRDNRRMRFIRRDRLTLSEAAEIWMLAFREGLETGLYNASIEGQRLNLKENTVTPADVAFLEEYIALCQKHNASLQYDPRVGMVVMNKVKAAAHE